MQIYNEFIGWKNLAAILNKTWREFIPSMLSFGYSYYSSEGRGDGKNEGGNGYYWWKIKIIGMKKEKKTKE